MTSPTQYPKEDLLTKYQRLDDKKHEAKAKAMWERDHKIAATVCGHGKNCKIGEGCESGKRCITKSIITGDLLGHLRAIEASSHNAHSSGGEPNKLDVVRVRETKESNPRSLLGIEVPFKSAKHVVYDLAVSDGGETDDDEEEQEDEEKGRGGSDSGKPGPSATVDLASSSDDE